MICNPAAGQSRQVNGTRVPAVNPRGVWFGIAESAQSSGGGQVEDENGAHAVITETLPEFDEEERAEAFRVSGKSGAIDLCVHIFGPQYIPQRRNDAKYSLRPLRPSVISALKLLFQRRDRGGPQRSQRKPFGSSKHLSEHT